MSGCQHLSMVIASFVNAHCLLFDTSEKMIAYPAKPTVVGQDCTGIDRIDIAARGYGGILLFHIGKCCKR